MMQDSHGAVRPGTLARSRRHLRFNGMSHTPRRRTVNQVIKRHHEYGATAPHYRHASITISSDIRRRGAPLSPPDAVPERPFAHPILPSSCPGCVSWKHPFLQPPGQSPQAMEVHQFRHGSYHVEYLSRIESVPWTINMGI